MGKLPLCPYFFAKLPLCPCFFAKLPPYPSQATARQPHFERTAAHRVLFPAVSHFPPSCTMCVEGQLRGMAELQLPGASTAGARCIWLYEPVACQPRSDRLKWARGRCEPSGLASGSACNEKCAFPGQSPPCAHASFLAGREGGGSAAADS